ncbi:hypothetical protein [Streptomyces lonarensis]|uniref:Uncharacterized protein n=1 Tax=Streptomyces lonarensis TaxID=700599 RepID=A0A7X6CXD6_9ACTN|nr:hypothetical protein [Streptomyces lonarensis]NJQ04263.1 hypothetical protein [Streptomyces lonarensis]
MSAAGAQEIAVAILWAGYGPDGVDQLSPKAFEGLLEALADREWIAPADGVDRDAVRAAMRKQVAA